MNRNLYITLITLLLTGTGLLLSGAAAAQSPGFEQDDYIKTAGITAGAQIGPLTPVQKQTTRIYYDGLGRTIQTVAEQASPLQHDLVQAAAYNSLGRQTTGYLPYADESTAITGSYRPNAITTDQPAFYNNNAQYTIATDGAPYSQQVFENSPLQRLLSAGMTGAGFQPVGGTGTQHYTTVSYRPNNSASDGGILQWNPDGSYSGSTYANNTLSVTDGKDEDGIETLSFTDLAGHLILKRQLYASGNLDTYYIYNTAGMISYVVPPKATGLLPANSYNLNAAPLSTLVFKYEYEDATGLGRLIRKTAPGKGAMSIVYDPLNRPVLLQDANMAANNNWNYIKYDVKGRAISQGIYNDVTHTGQAGMQAYVNTLSANYNSLWYESRTAALTGGGYYTGNVFPNTNITPLAYAYYDDYNMTEGSTPNFAYLPQTLPGETGATTAQVKGMATMVSKATVGAGLSGMWLTTAIFYDKRGNAIQQQSNNQLNYANAITLSDAKTTVPDFTGVPQVSLVKKVTGSGTTTVQTTFSYDQAYRINTVSQAYNGGSASVVASYSYNEIGQVIQKNLGQVVSGTIPATLNLNSAVTSNSTAVASSQISLSDGFSTAPGITFSAEIVAAGYLQTVDYRYNIRGQLLSINNSKLNNDGGVTNNDSNDLFGMQMLYDKADPNLDNGSGSIPSYDGKLTGVKWMSRDGSGNSTVERSYRYNYDQRGWYSEANYAERAQTSTGAFSNNVGGFDESSISYDAGGNLLSLYRNSSSPGATSAAPIDNLVYTYDTNNPNQLHTVTDGTGASYTGFGFRNLTGSTGSFTYDPNGNLVTDPYKGLTLTYDVLNRTDKITVTTATGRYINYTYDAGGNLIRKQAYDNNTLQTTMDYVDGFVYLNGTLSYFPMPEGRVLNNSGTLKQEFIIADQQGNARVSFQDNGSGTAVVKQENSYYGFGLIMANSPVAMPATPNKQLYNGGSEWQNDYSNLPDYYQTFNRNYDAAIGRFIGVDPEAESAESLSTYQYAGNNPITNNDPMGNKICSNCGPVYPTQTLDQSGGGNYGFSGGFGFNFNSGDDWEDNMYGLNNGVFNANFGMVHSFFTTDQGMINYLNLTGRGPDVISNSSASCNTCGVSFYRDKDGTISLLPNGDASNNYNIAVSNIGNDGSVTSITFDRINEADWVNLTGVDPISEEDMDKFMTNLFNAGGNIAGLKATVVNLLLENGLYKNVSGIISSYTSLSKFNPALALSEQGNLSKAFNSYRSYGTSLTWGSRVFGGLAIAWDISQGKPSYVIGGDMVYLGMAEIPVVGAPMSVFLWINSFIPESPSSNFANPGRTPGHYAEWLH